MTQKICKKNFFFLNIEGKNGKRERKESSLKDKKKVKVDRNVRKLASDKLASSENKEWEENELVREGVKDSDSMIFTQTRDAMSLLVQIWTTQLT